MDALYKKVNKSKECMTGAVELSPADNPFVRPSLLCFAAQSRDARSVYGAPKVGAAMARCRIKGNYRGGFDIDGMPISFLASTMTEREPSPQEFVDGYIVPLLEVDGHRVSLDEACRRLRNVNIITYCDGALKALAIEEVLTDRMRKMGYSEEEITKAMSSVFVLAVATDRSFDESKMSVTVFKDSLDMEVATEFDRDFMASQDREVLISASPNVHYYFYKGDGSHDFKKYALKGRVSALVSLVITSVLENALKNANGEYTPLNIDTIVALVKSLMEQELDEETIYSMIDQRVTYGGAPKMSREVAALRDELDDMYVKMLQQAGALERSDQARKVLSSQVQALQKACREYCSPINAKRILLEAVGWQVSKEELELIMSTPSDKETIEGLDDQLKK